MYHGTAGGEKTGFPCYYNFVFAKRLPVRYNEDKKWRIFKYDWNYRRDANGS